MNKNFIVTYVLNINLSLQLMIVGCFILNDTNDDIVYCKIFYETVDFIGRFL